MEVVHPQVAGIDVHKKVIWVAVRLPGQGPGQRALTVRRFKTFWRSLQKMASWLAEHFYWVGRMAIFGSCLLLGLFLAVFHFFMPLAILQWARPHRKQEPAASPVAAGEPETCPY